MMPPFSGLVQEGIRTLANQACLFIVPYVVFKSQPVPLAGNDAPAERYHRALPDEP